MIRGVKSIKKIILLAFKDCKNIRYVATGLVAVLFLAANIGCAPRKMIAIDRHDCDFRLRSELAKHVKVGYMVEITTITGQRYYGRIQEISSDSVVINRDSDIGERYVVVSFGEIDRVKVRRSGFWGWFGSLSILVSIYFILYLGVHSFVPAGNN